MGPIQCMQQQSNAVLKVHILNIKLSMYFHSSVCKTSKLLAVFCITAITGPHIVYILITSPPEGVALYCFHPVCLCVCVSVCVSGQYFGILFLGY